MVTANASPYYIGISVDNFVDQFALAKRDYRMYRVPHTVSLPANGYLLSTLRQLLIPTRETYRMHSLSLNKLEFIDKFISFDRYLLTYFKIYSSFFLFFISFSLRRYFKFIQDFFIDQEMKNQRRRNLRIDVNTLSNNEKGDLNEIQFQRNVI